MQFPHEEVGSRILEQRKKQGLTREQLAEKADISVQFLADIEKGRKSMTVATLRAIASALSVTTDSIVYGSRSPLPGVEDELYALCAALSPKQQTAAAKLLRVFFDTVRDL
ncbi:MAG: helix-turn-helix transcriptional regulator [Clostridia bacterium]|jgi:transcriptional regulator with XRE-family HTH domain|nr:helix-turn-helix transcriptional regulator [Clostridia bacterium]MBR0436764.1 helix-turn-helix transcriptional regulator [Clostridia bacterium]MBR3038672.1 helix-turn-helix transcriptional regulator [Clostridia bacterium]